MTPDRCTTHGTPILDDIDRGPVCLECDLGHPDEDLTQRERNLTEEVKLDATNIERWERYRRRKGLDIRPPT